MDVVKLRHFSVPVLPVQPYGGDEITHFFRDRASHHRNRIRVLFVRDHESPSNGFKIESGLEPKSGYLPAFLDFDRNTILAPDQRNTILAHIQQTVTKFAERTNGPSEHARQNRRLFEDIAAMPEILYSQLQQKALDSRFSPLAHLFPGKPTEDMDKQGAKFRMLPPWMQIMMIESETTYRYGYSRIDSNGGNIKQDGIFGLFTKLAGLGGVFTNHHDHLIKPEDDDPRWRDGIRVLGRNFWDTLFHEEGHKLSQYWGDFASIEGENPCLASQHPAWIEAVARTKAQTTVGNISLKFHLLFYPDDAHDEESLAEMTRHYTHAYIDSVGDDHQIENKLGRKFPDLWPAFRDIMIPQYSLMASKAYKTTSKMLSSGNAKDEANVTQGQYIPAHA